MSTDCVHPGRAHESLGLRAGGLDTLGPESREATLPRTHHACLEPLVDASQQLARPGREVLRAMIETDASAELRNTPCRHSPSRTSRFVEDHHGKRLPCKLRRAGEPTDPSTDDRDACYVVRAHQREAFVASSGILWGSRLVNDIHVARIRRLIHPLEVE